MTDDDKALVERLLQVDGRTTRHYRNPEGPEAAARIEALSARVAELEARERRLEGILRDVQRDHALYETSLGTGTLTQIGCALGPRPGTRSALGGQPGDGESGARRADACPSCDGTGCLKMVGPPCERCGGTGSAAYKSHIYQSVRVQP